MASSVLTSQRLLFQTSMVFVVRIFCQSVLAKRWIETSWFITCDCSVVADVNALSSGANLPRISPAVLLGLEIPLPPLAEQRRIAAILDQADALRTKRRESIAHLGALSESLFEESFGNQFSNDSSSADYKLIDLVETIQTGPFGSLLHKEDYVSDGIPLVNPLHIQDGKIQPDWDQSISPEKAVELKTYLLEQGDIVMGRRGEMGRCALVTTHEAGYLCGTGSLIIRPDLKQLSAEYLVRVLSRPGMKDYLLRNSLGTTLPNLNQSIVGSIPIALPPLDAQLQFERIVGKIETLKASHRAHLAELDTLFASLQHQAFSRELTASRHC